MPPGVVYRAGWGYTPFMQITDLGLIPYADACKLQEEALAQVIGGAQERLFILEHPPTITFGRNGGRENLPAGAGFFKERGIEIVQSSRGGNITCHFPGQLVAYPVLRVEKRPGGLKAFFHQMEQAAICTLSRFGVSAARQEGRPGVWVGKRKIASIGIGVKRWVTYHGLSLNIGADLSLFDLVSPCGLPVAATSLTYELGAAKGVTQRCEEPPMAEVKTVFIQEFMKLFGPCGGR